MNTKENLKSIQNPTSEGQPAPQQAPNRPVMAFQNGGIRTRIWANPTLWGDVSWGVDQLRVFVRSSQTGETRSGETKTFDLADLNDARWGLYLAEKWIKKVERRRRRLRLAFWI
jgi:hypothetical protein